MTLPFQEEVVNDKKYSPYNFEKPNFIGYLNRYGEVVNYKDPLGLVGHDRDWTTTYFENYFIMPTHDEWLQDVEGISIIDRESQEFYRQEGYKHFKKQSEHDANLIKKYGKNMNTQSIFLADLNSFFYNCYQAATFMEGFGQNCMCLNENEFWKKYFIRRKNLDEDRIFDEFDYQYYWYKKEVMLDWYKSVIVQYMHYHLIERCQKGITTSDLKPIETFYNYLLNDFEIHQIPRMVFDNEKKTYVPFRQNEFLIPDSELRLQDEIQAIKKLVPLKERSKYYR